MNQIRVRVRRLLGATFAVIVLSFALSFVWTVRAADSINRAGVAVDPLSIFFTRLADEGGAYLISGLCLFLFYKLTLRWVADLRAFADERKQVVDELIEVVRDNTRAMTTLVEEIRRQGSRA